MWQLILLIIILTIIVIILGTQFFNIIFRGFAPFISTKPQVIQKIAEELIIDENAKIYELGCGQAGFLRALTKKYPKAELIGVEYAFLPWLIANIQASLSKSKIKILRRNIFAVNLADADLIYCYLNINMMQELEHKFKKECRSGTQIISYQFRLPNMDPEKIIELNNKKDKIYFYKIK